MSDTVRLETVRLVLGDMGINGPLRDEILRRVTAASGQSAPNAVAPTKLPTITAVARSFLRDSLRRTEVMGHQIEDPSWNMMLALFADTMDGRPVSTSSAVYASGVPPTTALRYVERMARDGLVSKRDDPADKRRTFLLPTSVAMTRVEQMIRAFCVAPPPEGT